MPEWILQILIGVVIVGLISVIFSQMLTKAEHGRWCHANTEEIKLFIREELNKFDDALDLKIENAILKAIKKVNDQ